MAETGRGALCRPTIRNMTDRGWYDDPDGTPFRLRYWDGSQWTDQLAPAASRPAPAGSPGSANSWLKPALIGLLILALLGGAYTLLVRTEVIPGPGAQVTGRKPGQFDSPTSTPSQGLRCPSYYTGPRSEQITGEASRVYGGQLSMTRPADAQASPVTLSFADSQEFIAFEVVGDWVAPALLGRVVHADGFTDLVTASRLVMHCLVHDPILYSDVTDRTEIFSESITVDGHQAHRLRYEVRVAQPEYPELAGDLVDVIVVDTDDPLGFSFFFGAWPIDDAQFEARMAELESSLRVER